MLIFNDNKLFPDKSPAVEKENAKLKAENVRMKKVFVEAVKNKEGRQL